MKKLYGDTRFLSYKMSKPYFEYLSVYLMILYTLKHKWGLYQLCKISASTGMPAAAAHQNMSALILILTLSAYVMYSNILGVLNVYFGASG